MEQIVSYFARPENGIQGIIIISLVYLIVWQQKRVDTKDTIISDLQEKRKADTDTYTKAYTELTKDTVSTMKDNINATNLLQRSMDSFSNSFSSFINGKSKN